jgi:DNA (cytosine-5)-methyltransferase 1
MTKPILLDLFCGGGGSAVGYHRAGFDVVGVDIKPMPRYPFEFHQADALEYCAAHGAEFDAIHASPVCKNYTRLRSLFKDREYPDQIAETRETLLATGKPYVIENVIGAPLTNYVMLCGSMFGLRVYRHRLFECNPPIYFSPMSCNHWGKSSGNRLLKAGMRVTPNLRDFEILTVTGHDFILGDALKSMGIDWMNQAEISQAIPPAYTEFIGRHLMQVITGELA